MNIVRNIVLYLLLLIANAICGTIVLKIFDLLLSLGFENIWISGFKVGFIAWIGMIAIKCYRYFKDKRQK